jgi:hypothetical protein
VLYPTYLALEVLFGRGLAAAMDFTGDFEARALPMNAAMLGGISMMCAYVARGTFHDLEALRPILLGGKNTFADLRRELTRFERRRLWIGALIGFVIFSVIHEIRMARWTRLLAGEWSLRDPCSAAVFIGFWMVAGWGTMYLIDSARIYSRIGERHVEIDLLDLSPLLPLARHGLRIVLLLTLITALGCITLVVGFPSSHSPIITPLAQVLVVCFCNLLLATAIFLLPVRGLRRQIRARKSEKLAQLRDEIRRNEELVTKAGPESAEAGGRLPGLMVLEKRIESVREWPFDAPTLTRFFLYVAIPLGSWVGGALVERLLGAALD